MVFSKPLQRVSNPSKQSFLFPEVFLASFQHFDGNHPNIFRIPLQKMVKFNLNFQANFHSKFITILIPV